MFIRGQAARRNSKVCNYSKGGWAAKIKLGALGHVLWFGLARLRLRLARWLVPMGREQR